MSISNQIKVLEEKNTELSKEILLNETAVYEVEKKFLNIDKDIIEHPEIQAYVNSLQDLLRKIKFKNEIYKKEIYENNIKISNLEEGNENNE